MSTILSDATAESNNPCFDELAASIFQPQLVLATEPVASTCAAPLITTSPQCSDDADDDRHWRQVAAELDPQAAVETWQITALGHRPIDFAVRDILIGSFLRDKRLNSFKQPFSEPPEWIVRHIEHLPAGDRKQAVQLTAIQFAHQQMWAKLSGQLDPFHSDIVQRVQNCPPMGMLVQLEGASPVDYQPCRLARVCPSCYARLGVQLHDRLQLGLWDDGVDKFFVLIKLRIDDEMLDSANLSSALAGRVDFVRTTVVGKARQFAETLGVVGGLSFLDVGPFRTYEPNWSGCERVGNARYDRFAFNVSILGEIGTDVTQLREAFDRRDVTIQIARGVETSPVVTVRSGQVRSSLRQLLFGSSFKFTGYPVIGALSVEPWLLATPDQLVAYLEATWNKKLFAAFGTWQTTLPKRPRQLSLPEHQQNARPYRRQRARMHAVNVTRRNAAAVRLADSREIAEQVWQELSQTGRTPGRKVFSAAMEEHGITVSDRDARRLVKELSAGASQRLVAELV